ncbi:MAG: PAS domain-containing sensor histidine kinase, partial [Thermodesulfobacteriota bacterium]
GSIREIKGLKKNGDEFPMEVSISKCKIEGRLTYTLIIFDITERKNLEQQLLQSAKLAAVGELISGVTHEVNNPLAVVLGYSEMLIQEYKDNEELSKIIKIIYSESERARKVIHNLLSFARQHKPEKEVVKISEIIDNTISLTEYDLRKQKIEVVKNYNNTVPSILADPNQLQQVFLNLIINAQHAISEHKDSGKITITVNTASTSKHIEICIEDDGAGIPKKIMEKIFDPFFTTKSVGKGTGLGLSVSFGIINRHSGEIKVESEEGIGTKFFIKLPIEIGSEEKEF